MKTSISTHSLTLWVGLVLMVMGAGVPTSVTAQFIDTGTPTATVESGSGGDWGNLLPGRGDTSATSTTPALVGEVFVLPSSGVEVVVGSGVTTDTSADTEVPDQIIIETEEGLGAIAVLESFGRPSDILESYVGGFGETMDSVVEVNVESSRELATGIYRVETDGIVLYMYISVDAITIEDYMVIEVIIAGSTGMESSLQQMRENVTINGVPAFAAVNDQDVIEIITRDAG